MEGTDPEIIARLQLIQSELERVTMQLDRMHVDVIDAKIFARQAAQLAEAAQPAETEGAA